MMNFFCEHPWRLAMTGIAVLVFCFLVARATGQRPWYIATLLVVPLWCALFVVERRVVTLREAIDGVLHEIADDLVTNQVERVLRHVSPTRPDLLRQTRRLLPRYEIHQARVKSNLRVERVADETAEIVRARFNAVFLVSETKGEIHNLLSPWFFVVDFREEGGTWKVVRYERHDPRKGLQGLHP